jgi:hypothetical protein
MSITEDTKTNMSRNNLLYSHNKRKGKYLNIRNKSLKDFSYKTVFKNQNYHIVGRNSKNKPDLEIHPNESSEFLKSSF